MKTTIYLVRHGTTDWNEAGRYQGLSDIGLNKKGIEEAIEAGKLLAKAPINKIYSSPLVRAKRTAEEIAKHHNLPVYVVEELKERSYGDYEGMTFDEIERQPYFRKHLRENWYLQGAPNGESFEESSLRVGKALSEIVSDHINETIAIVAHGGVIKGIGHHIGHFEKEHVANIIIPNAQPLQVEYLHSEKRYNVIDFPAARRK